ncbi:MAG: DNA translocase FtsK [Oscillospiraceae bacterium]|jgi:S-DNA-T family DNA segregation ATPase FtsK/SpoIIIE
MAGTTTTKKRGRPSKKAEEARIAREKAEAKKKERHAVRSIVMFAVGALLFALSVIPGESLWLTLHEVMAGIFGQMTYFVGPTIILVAILYTYKKRPTDMERTAAVLLLLTISGALFVFGTPESSELSFSQSISGCYESGKHGIGGGALSCLIGWTLSKLLGITGAKVVTVILGVAFLVMLTGRTIADLVKQARDRRIDETDDFEPITVNLPKPQREKPKNQDIDVPISGVGKREIDIPLSNREAQKRADERAAEEMAAREKAAADAAAVPAEKPAAAPAEASDSGRTQNKKDIFDYDVKFVPSKDHKDGKENTRDIDIPLGPWDEIPAEEQHATGPAGTLVDDVYGGIETAKKQDEDIFATFSGAGKKDTNRTYTFGQEEALPENREGKASSQSRYEQTVLADSGAAQGGKPVKPYIIPPLSLLQRGSDKNQTSEADLKSTGEFLVKTLESFGVSTKIVGISRGPTVTRYDLQPQVGVRLNRITNLADDLALNLATPGIRIVAPIPNKAAVGVEVPNKIRSTVALRNVLESPDFRNSKAVLPVGLGKDISGADVIPDISEMPHLLIAGTTGSGKSICLHTMIVSMLYRFTPDELKFILIDPKMVEFGRYNGLPHLLIPVVMDARKAAGALGWAVGEMIKRYKTFSECSARDIDAYNGMVERDFKGTSFEGSEDRPRAKMPRIVIVIDELSDLMMAAPNEVEDYICRLAQMARAAGIHLIIATQRPSVDVITGVIKANISSRIALSVTSQVDSRTILDMGGAEKLLGRGDMLYFPMSYPKPVRVQGCYVSDREIDRVTDFIKKHSSADYDPEISEEIERQAAKEDQKSSGSQARSGDGGDEMLMQAIEVVVEAGQASTSLLQRKLKLGYARAARIMDTMEEMGVVSQQDGSKPRNVLWSMNQFQEYRLRADSGESENGTP